MDANLVYLEVIAGDGAWAVSSQRDCERGYIATTSICTCEAGRSGDPVCCHRALIRALVGAMPIEFQSEPCRHCHRQGSSFSEPYGERRLCDACDGTGRRPAHQPVPTPRPVVVGSSQIAA